MHNNPDNRVLLAFFLDLLGDVGCRVLCSTFRRAQGQGRELAGATRFETAGSESMFPVSPNEPAIPNRRASAKLEEIRLMQGTTIGRITPMVQPLQGRAGAAKEFRTRNR